MYLSYVVACILLGISFSSAGNEFDHDGWLQLRLWHALNDDPVPIFIERGNITVTSIRTEISTVSQTDLRQSQIVKLKNLADHNEKYRLKVVARSSSGSETTFLTFVPACSLLGSNLEDTLLIWLDSAAELVSVNLISSGLCSLEMPTKKVWSTRVQIKYPDSGSVPDTATYIQKLEREREARERGETKDTRSFLAKYWIYIIPGLIFFVLTSATNPEVGGGGGGTVQRQ